jgi:hypothetical protein
MEKAPSSFSKADRSFDETRTMDYDLVLQVAERSCAYSVFDQGRNSYIALEAYDISLSGMAEQIHWLKNPFRSVHILVENNRSTLIPGVLFNESEKETYLNFSLDSIEDEKIRFDRLGMLEVVNIFGTGKNLDDDICNVFPDAKVCHLSSFLIETIWMNFKNLIQEKKSFVFVRQADFNLLIFDNKQLIYSNAFHFRAPEDVVYFLIFVMEQMDLNPEEIPLTLLGNIEKGSPHFDLLFRYIRNIDFAARNENLNYSHVFNDVPGHKWYSLLNPVMCGS